MQGADNCSVVEQLSLCLSLPQINELESELEVETKGRGDAQRAAKK